jgi:hypothetical protein
MTCDAHHGRALQVTVSMRMATALSPVVPFAAAQ